MGVGGDSGTVAVLVFVMALLVLKALELMLVVLKELAALAVVL